MKLTTLALKFQDTDYLPTIKAVKTQILKERTEIEIVHKVKETSKYLVKVTYQIEPLGGTSKAFIEFLDKRALESGKTVLTNLECYEDIFFLVSSITVSNGAINLKPRDSFVANLHTSKYKTPMQVGIQEILNGKRSQAGK